MQPSSLDCSLVRVVKWSLALFHAFLPSRVMGCLIVLSSVTKVFVTHVHIFSSRETHRCASFDSSFVVLRTLVSQMTLLVLLNIILHLWTGLSCKWVSHCCCCWCSQVLELVMVTVKLPSGKVLPLNLRFRSLCFLYIPTDFYFFSPSLPLLHVTLFWPGCTMIGLHPVADNKALFHILVHGIKWRKRTQRG